MVAASTIDTNTDEGAAPTALPFAKRRKRKRIVTGLTVLACGGTGALLHFIRLPVFPLGLSSESRAVKAAAPGPVEFPEIIDSNAGPHQTSLVRLRANLKLSKWLDEAALQGAQARMQDLSQTYLCNTRPEELREAARVYWLYVTENLPTELLVQ